MGNDASRVTVVVVRRRSLVCARVWARGRFKKVYWDIDAVDPDYWLLWKRRRSKRVRVIGVKWLAS